MLNDKMKDKLKELNLFLGEHNETRPKPANLRSQLSQHGRFVKFNKMTPSEIASMANGKGIVGVDGSYTTYGNTFPHIVFLAQALAKCTLDPLKEGAKETEIETGLTAMHHNPEINSDNFIQTMRQKVAQMEVTAATNALFQYSPFITMFDGGFWRLFKDAEELWTNFRKSTVEKEALVVGVIEDVGSFDLHQLLEPKVFFPDSDLLFGLLDIGEVYIPNQPYREQFRRAFARFSFDPLPIACDFIPEQITHMEDILRLVYTLTPEQGRGIPLWIDIVDKEVKLTHETTDLLMDAYIDPVYKERFFTGKRNRR